MPDDDSSNTPASARHKRGCNCKKSGCSKKYCECYQVYSISVDTCLVLLFLKSLFKIQAEGYCVGPVYNDVLVMAWFFLEVIVKSMELEHTRLFYQNISSAKGEGYFHWCFIPEAQFDGIDCEAAGLLTVRDLDLFCFCVVFEDTGCILPTSCTPSQASRVAEVFAKRLQDPQRLANEFCAALQNSIKPSGVAVILPCSHIHFLNFEPAFFDSNDQGYVKILVSSGSRVFDDEKADIWTDFLILLRLRGITLENPGSRNPVNKSWCTCQTFCKNGTSDLSMPGAVSSIISSLGEVPLRKELVGTPSRFVKWLMNFKNSSLDLKLNGLVLSKRDSFDNFQL